MGQAWIIVAAYWMFKVAKKKLGGVTLFCSITLLHANHYQGYQDLNIIFNNFHPCIGNSTSKMILKWPNIPHSWSGSNIKSACLDAWNDNISNITIHASLLSNSIFFLYNYLDVFQDISFCVPVFVTICLLSNNCCPISYFRKRELLSSTNHYHDALIQEDFVVC